MADEPTTTTETAPETQAPAPAATPPPAQAPEPLPDVLDGVPEKFRRDTVQDTLKAALAGYSELEKAWSKKKPDPTPQPPPASAFDENTDINTIIEKAGLTQDEVVESFNTNQDLTDEQYAKITATGIPAKLARQMVQGIKAEVQLDATRRTSIEAAINEAAGGEDAAVELIQQAQNTLPAQVLEGIKVMVNGPDATPESARKAMELLRGQVPQQANAPSPVTGSPVSSGPSATQKYESWGQTQNAMNDIRFRQTVNGYPNPDYDPAYAESVMKAVDNTPMEAIAGCRERGFIQRKTGG